MGKKLPCISQGMKKTYLINKFVKIVENYAPSCVFFGIMRIMHSEPDYAILHLRIIPEALSQLRSRFLSQLSILEFQDIPY